jgi:hypothetical protein
VRQDSMIAMIQSRYVRLWLVFTVVWIVILAAWRYLTSGIFFFGFLSPQFIVETLPSQVTCDAQGKFYNALQCSEYQRIAMQRCWSVALDAGVIFGIPLIAGVIAFIALWTIHRKAA